MIFLSTIPYAISPGRYRATNTTTGAGYGLPWIITTSGTDAAGPRTITTTYSNNGTSPAADGYFPYTVSNVLGHSSTQHTDPKHGQPISQWDPNFLKSTTGYDAFGRVAQTTPPGQPTAYQRFHWCVGELSCPAGTVYRVSTLRDGAPEAHVYFDKLGRERQSSVRTFDNSSYVNVTTEFDERGNIIFESQPYDLNAPEESATIGTRYTSYDALGRLTHKEVDQTNGQILHTDYNHTGFVTAITVTAIDADDISMHRIYNGLGQLVETRDGAGGYTRYAYDAAGNPIVIADPVMDLDPAIDGIKAAYNAFGHKLWVEDPDWWNDMADDHGIKTFTYNALGEVLSETDPNGNIIEMVYDELGRMIERKVNGELNGKWYFDNPDTYKGLGLLHMEDSQFRDDGSRLQKFYYYSDAGTTFRKDLLQVTHRFYENNDQNDFTDYHTATFTDNVYARPKGLRYPGGTSLAFSYNDWGFLIEEKDPLSGVIYRQATDFNSRGQLISASIANHTGNFQYGVTRDYHVETGQFRNIAVTNGPTPVLDLEYNSYDAFGNVKTRYTNYGSGTTETFNYDALQRLTASVRVYLNGAPDDLVSYNFDASGSFESKGDYATAYHYDPFRPHVLASVDLTGGGSVSFMHDSNGNLTVGDNEVIGYNAFNKPVQIRNFAKTTATEFAYGADTMRYKQTTPTGSTIYYLDKLMEIEMAAGLIRYRHYLGDVAILTKIKNLDDPNPAIDYLFRDRLGSIAMIGDATGTIVEQRGHDAYGKPRNGDWSDKAPATLDSAVTDRGFTDHEHLDDWQLIHMNGRGYDYNLGRFLSIDPIIQAPGNSQSINPYTYIMNNPLSGIDPTGYEAVFEETKKWTPTGSHIPREVTVTGTINSSGDQVFSYVSDNGGSAKRAVKGAVEGALKDNGFKAKASSASDGSGSQADQIGSQQQVANGGGKSGSVSQAGGSGGTQQTSAGATQEHSSGGLDQSQTGQRVARRERGTGVDFAEEFANRQHSGPVDFAEEFDLSARGGQDFDLQGVSFQTPLRDLSEDVMLTTVTMTPMGRSVATVVRSNTFRQGMVLARDGRIQFHMLRLLAGTERAVFTATGDAALVARLRGLPPIEHVVTRAPMHTPIELVLP